ncbi:hypothetical protein Pyn_38774 [Prunus yedoensis var. nudiflora]|uniref:Uncharacterized protein n=1 Tax=Prunus yedoensis var. nudiflora TaxID=2094558 RepID=A0A314ZAM6_PRUYE|nr:hypothetical protein Pyn_38774 [Prunus yedoensis var. nudiflora]
MSLSSVTKAQVTVTHTQVTPCHANTFSYTKHLAHMNPSHVVHGACTRDCGVEGYGGPQGPQKLLDNGDFRLAT